MRTKHIEFDQVWKRYGNTIVLRDINWSVSAGDLCWIAGPNGAGKSTLAKLAARILAPDQGSIHRTIVPTVVTHQSQLLASKSVYANLRYQARIYSATEDVLDSVGALFGVKDFWHLLPAKLSRGMTQRVALARAFAFAKDCVILDEPETGLDTAGKEALELALQASRDAGMSIVLISHNRFAKDLPWQEFQVEDGRLCG